MRFRWVCHSYCLMGNHYYLLIKTLSANLSQGMRQLNVVYIQSFNRRHSRVGHLFQGRFKAIIVEKDAHLKELCRYVALNPIRAKIVRHPEQWWWSGPRATIGVAQKPDWLHTDWILSQFGSQRKRAIKAYAGFVREEAKSSPTPWEEMKQQGCFADILLEAGDKKKAIVAAYQTGHYSQKEIADFLGLHYCTVSREIGKRKF